MVSSRFLLRVTNSRPCAYEEVIAAESAGTIGVEEEGLAVPRKRWGRIVRGGIQNGIPPLAALSSLMLIGIDHESRTSRRVDTQRSRPPTVPARVLEITISSPSWRRIAVRVSRNGLLSSATYVPALHSCRRLQRSRSALQVLT